MKYPAGAVSYELRAPGQAPSPWSKGPTAWQPSDSSVRDGQDPPLRSGAVLGIVRKAATCINDNLVTCALSFGWLWPAVQGRLCKPVCGCQQNV